MDWNEALGKTIHYLEEHLLEDTAAEDAAKAAAVSPFYLQKGFKMVTGFSISEYVRCRRLYLAALDILAGNGKLIDLSYRYGYETPESFTKAFGRFHGVSPTQLKNEPARLRVFLPLKIKIIIQGGNGMDYTVEKMEGFQVIGFEREFSFDSSYAEIPKFWDEISEKYLAPLYSRNPPQDEISRAAAVNKIGKYGICIDDAGKKGVFRYLIAGKYLGGKVPQGLTVFEFPALEWAKFRCVGPMPDALQSVNTQIFQEWLPGNPDFEIAMGANIEWYSSENMNNADYESAIWIPVKRKSL